MSIGGTAAYEGEEDLPRLVTRAVALARQLDFDYSCLPDQGRLLQSLARGRRQCRIGETGSGCGVGLAWLVSAVDETTPIVSVEIDPERAEAVARLFAEHPNVTVLSGSWKRIESQAPFDLLVLDGGGTGKNAETDPERADPGVLLSHGGTLVIDDFTPSVDWPREVGGEVDAVRMTWLEHPELLATEIRVTEHVTTLVATRR